MSRSTQTPYLRLVDTPAREPVQTVYSDDDGTLLGFVDMASMSDDGFKAILSRVQPSWVFDLRPVPYFDIGRLNRRRVFDLFSALCATYRDVAGWLQITDRNDASLNSGAVARYLAETLSTRVCNAPIVVLVDDDEILCHALQVLPNHLAQPFAVWRAFKLEAIARDGEPDLVLRTASGDAVALEAKWLGDRAPSSAGRVEAFRLWLGDDMFAVNCELDDGRVTQVALPLAAAGLMEQSLAAALARCVTAPHHGASAAGDDHHTSSRRASGEPMHVVALHVESVQVRAAHDGRTILVTFGHARAERTHAVFTLEGARRLRSQLQLLVRG